MGKGWLHWIARGGEGGRGGGGRPTTTKKEAESASAGCMFAVFHLFHSHHLQFPSSHRNQEPTTSRGGVEAPRNSLELEQEISNFPMGIQIKTKPRISDEISSESNSPAAKTPIVARLMGLDLLPQSTSLKCNTFFHDDIAAAAPRSLPETPRVSSSSSRKSDVERHRLSLQLNQESGRRGRSKQNENRNTAQRRSVGVDITNTVAQSRRDENLLLLNLKPAGKNSKNQILQKQGRRILSKPTSSSKENHIPLQKECKKGNFSSSRLKKVPPPRAAALSGRKEGEFFRRREKNRMNFTDKIVQVKKFRGPSPPPTRLPQKQMQSSQVSDAISSKSSAKLSKIPSQSYNQLQLSPIPPCSSATNGGGSSPEQRNYIQLILKHTGIINQGNPFAKWHTPSNPIDPGIFHHLELSAAADGGDSVLSHQCNRKLIFQLVDELLAEILTPHLSSKRRLCPVIGNGVGFPVVEELCKKIDSFPAAKCVVLEDIDLLIATDFCKSRWNGYSGEEEEMVSEIESEMVEWMVREAVAVMAGDATAEEQTAARVLLGKK